MFRRKNKTKKQPVNILLQDMNIKKSVKSGHTETRLNGSGII